MKRCAAIDIGTNTILLLIAEQTPEGLPQPIMDLETTTRLGEGILRTHRINPRAMQESIDVINRYLSLSRDMGVSKVVAVGTSSLREARNRSEFLRRVKRRCGLEIEIISGREEARLSYLAVAKDQKWSSGPLAVIDIGGGSTEWIYGDAVGEVRVFSLNIGALTLTEQFLTSNPVKEGDYQAMASHVGKLLVNMPPLRENPPLVGIGGTITTLFSVKQGLRDFDPSRIHYGVLKLEDVEGQIELFKILPLRERKAIAGLPPERADVIIAGATILLYSLLRFGSNQIRISCHGLRYGILAERFL
jgi:exopolyphosphatase/guanosine-5'-triphosphate,3'-diphosphate pyrophosphatase